MRKHKLLIAVIMFGLTWAGIVKAEDQPIEQQLVDAMNKVFGAHPGFRANHAKGIVVEGNFKGSAEAAGLSRAVLFNGSPIPATVRFSDSTDDSTKDPTIPWPSDRKVVELGVLTIDKAAPNSAEAEKKLLFLSGQLTDGIEESDDPLIDTRNGAYALSFSRRNP